MTKASFLRRAPQRSTGSQNLLGWLGRDTKAAGVLMTARRHMQIRQAFLAVLPEGLGAACQVARLEEACLTLAVPNASHAAKLRQLAPSLAEALARQGWNINEIKVRIQADIYGPAPYAPPPKEAKPLDGKALQAFTALHDQLQPGPLADAVARLLKRHGPSKDGP